MFETPKAAIAIFAAIMAWQVWSWWVWRRSSVWMRAYANWRLAGYTLFFGSLLFSQWTSAWIHGLTIAGIVCLVASSFVLRRAARRAEQEEAKE